MPKAFIPAVLTASDLLDGDAVWWTGEVWSRDIVEAHVATDEDARAKLETLATSPVHDSAVVVPYLVDVSVANGAPTPVVRREAIRAEGAPTFAYVAAPTLEKAA